MEYRNAKIIANVISKLALDLVHHQDLRTENPNRLKALVLTTAVTAYNAKQNRTYENVLQFLFTATGGQTTVKYRMEPKRRLRPMEDLDTNPWQPVHRTQYANDWEEAVKHRIQVVMEAVGNHIERPSANSYVEIDIPPLQPLLEWVELTYDHGEVSNFTMAA